MCSTNHAYSTSIMYASITLVYYIDIHIFFVSQSPQCRYINQMTWKKKNQSQRPTYGTEFNQIYLNIQLSCFCFFPHYLVFVLFHCFFACLPISLAFVHNLIAKIELYFLFLSRVYSTAMMMFFFFILYNCLVIC